MVNFSYFCTFFKPKSINRFGSMKTFTFRPKLFSSLKGYSKETFTADLMAGIIVGIVALPLAIAFGIASGVSPEKGIITAIIAGFVISLLGGSKVQIGGPTGAFIVIVYGIIARYGETGLIVATIMAGAILVMLGVFKLGTVIKFIPYPIVVGFTSGIAVTIFTTQIKDLLGLSADSVPADFLPKWQCYFENIGTADPLSVVVGIGSIAIIALWPRISKKIPGSLVAIFAMTLLTYLLRRYAGVTSIETIGDRFQISASLPGVAVPDMSWDVIKGLFPAAVTIAVLGAIESLLSATVADGVTGDKHDSNQELIAQGAANIVTPLFGGIPATGAIARTMTNINNGGKTPVAGLIHAAVLLLILLCLGPLTRHIPMACLAGVLVIVAYNMSEWRTFRALMSNPSGRSRAAGHVPADRPVRPDRRHRGRTGDRLPAVHAPRGRNDEHLRTERRDRSERRRRHLAGRGTPRHPGRSRSLRDRRALLFRNRQQIRRTDGRARQPPADPHYPDAESPVHRLDGDS